MFASGKPEQLWNFNGYSHSLDHPEIIFPSRFSLSKKYIWDYERHWLNETMKDAVWTRLWETLIERDYERHWLYEAMRDTDCTRLWETLIERDYERH
jgi:hypothetical protein